MTPKKIAAIVLACTMASTAAVAGKPTKPCTSEPQANWKPVKEIEDFVTKHGYTISKSKLEGNCLEIYARDAKGQRVEFFIDPVTGYVVEADQKRPIN